MTIAEQRRGLISDWHKAAGQLSSPELERLHYFLETILLADDWETVAWWLKPLYQPARRPRRSRSNGGAR